MNEEKKRAFIGSTRIHTLIYEFMKCLIAFHLNITETFSVKLAVNLHLGLWVLKVELFVK